MRYASQSMNIEAALRDVRHHRANVRARGADALAKASGKNLYAARDVLRQSLSDVDSEVRCAAALSLGELADLEALHPLINLLQTDSDTLVRQTAVVALARIGNNEALPVLIRALDDPSADVRFHLVAALAQLSPQSAPAYLEKLLADPDPDVRGNAAAALGDLQHHEAADEIASLLEDPAPATQVEAAVALARLSDSRGTQTLVSYLEHPEFEHLAAEYLYRLPTQKAVPALQKTAQRRFGDPFAKTWAAGALARLGHPFGKGSLLESLESRRSMVRGLTIEILGELAPTTPWAKQALENFLKSRDATLWRDELNAALSGNSG
ncbi:MAG: HEAT repeat domain-containing protein [Pseudomonadota bacterium]